MELCSIFFEQVWSGLLSLCSRFSMAPCGNRSLGGVYNMWLGSTRPHEYLGFADLVLIPVYCDFILGQFAKSPGPYVLTIASGQLISAALMIMGGR